MCLLDSVPAPKTIEGVCADSHRIANCELLGPQLVQYRMKFMVASTLDDTVPWMVRRFDFVEKLLATVTQCKHCCSRYKLCFPINLNHAIDIDTWRKQRGTNNYNHSHDHGGGCRPSFYYIIIRI